MKQKKLILSLILLCFLLTAAGCSSGSSSDSSLNFSDSQSSGASSFEDDAMMDETSEDVVNESEGIADETSGASSSSADDGASGSDTASSSKINTDMLVYTCNLSIDTLDYDQSVSTFRNLLTAAGGFIEEENYSDGQSSTSYYIEEYEKNKIYHATVRVPHDKYDEFLNGADQLGDVRSKSANVQNVGQEYTDLNTSLQIYEAKEKRYIEMLATIKDDTQAIHVEKELTELQISIAKLKTRMNKIREDVDYSTIDIQIREVTKYEEHKEPEKTDTFFQRLQNTIKDTWKYFLIFLEGLLFFIIRVFPYAAILLIILLIILWNTKKQSRKKEKRFPAPETAEFPKPEFSEPEANTTEEIPDDDTDTKSFPQK